MLNQEPKQHTRLSLEEYYNLTGQTREILELKLFKIKHSMVLQGKLRPSGSIIDVLALKKKFASLSFPIQNHREPLFFKFLKPEQSDPDCLNICEDHVLWICYINFFLFQSVTHLQFFIASLVNLNQFSNSNSSSNSNYVVSTIIIEKFLMYKCFQCKFFIIPEEDWLNGQTKYSTLITKCILRCSSSCFSTHFHEFGM